LRSSLVIATYWKVRLIPHDFARLASECFDQPVKKYFFNNLLEEIKQQYILLRHDVQQNQ
jgi:hypothetical protein